jgi:hypothetical protein
MYSHIKLGAINQTTGKYERVLSASKQYKYICPVCEKDVSFAHGIINKSHFKHAPNSNCNHYNGGESSLHYNGKRLIKDMLENNKIEILQECFKCKETELSTIPNNILNKVVIEYGFIYDNRQRYADVALLNKNGNPIAMFEVFNTHKTKEEYRPEPWFEISAIEINELDTTNNNFVLNCVRNYFCDECKKQNVIEYNKQQEIYRIARENQMEIDRIACEKQMEIDRITQDNNILIKNRIIHSKIYKPILIDLKKKVDRLVREKQQEIYRIAREKQMEIDRIARENKLKLIELKKQQIETKLTKIIQTQNINISNECSQCKNKVITMDIKKSINTTITFDYCKYVNKLENIKITLHHQKYTFGIKYINQLLTSNCIITEKICDICITNNNNKINRERERRGELSELDKIRIDKQLIIDRMIKKNKPTIVKKNNKQLQVSKYVKN